MYQIGIVSKNSRRLLQFQAELDQSFTLTPKVFLWADKVIEQLKSRQLDGLIICLDVVGASQVRLVKQFIQMFEDIPIVVMGELIGPTALKALEKIDHPLAVRHVSEVDQTPGIMEKLLKGRNVSRRSHKRFGAETAISVRAQTDEAIVIGSGKMHNLGHGGLRAVVFGKNWAPGDSCIIEVPGSIPGRSRSVNAEVVWIKDIQTRHPQTGRVSHHHIVGFSFQS